MKRLLLLAATFLSLLLPLAHVAQADDFKSMEGKWKVDSAEVNGKIVDAPELKDIQITISGDRYEALIKDHIDRGSLKLDETQKPRTMDATKTEGDEVGKMIKAIYEINGDTMRVCYAMTGDARPTEFATKPDSALLLITYRREKE